MNRVFSVISLALVSACGGNLPDHDPSIETPHVGVEAPANISFNVIGQYPHDTSAYTQGLEFFEGKLYESTGDYSNSSLRITNNKTGQVTQKHVMGSEKIFGEGITIFNNKIYQLTWQSHEVYVYDVKDITKPIKTLNWPYDGWGITHDSSSLIISDGTSNIYFVDPETFKVKNTLAVKDNEGNVRMLNELEYVNGYIYANVYETDVIVKIDAESGIIKGRMNLANLLQDKDYTDRTDVLNGIALDPTTGHLWITGKRWPKMFEVKVD